MSYEITGLLIEKFDTVYVSDKFSKREIVLEVRPDNPNLTFTDMIKFQLTNDRCDLVDNISIGSSMKVHFNIRGKKWEKDGKVSYFTNLEIWKIEDVESTDAPQSEEVQRHPEEKSQELPPATEGDDLPF